MNAADFADLESPLDAAPLFFVEPRDKLPASELQRQQTFLALLKTCAPGVVAMAFPNAGKRSDWERLQRERGRCQRFARPCAVLGLRHGLGGVQSRPGTLSSAQISLLNRLHRLGHKVAMVRRPETALSLLADWGAPVRHAA
jgi:hypothetical protein